MPKVSKKKAKVKRHDPLEHQIVESMQSGYLKAPKPAKKKENEGEKEEGNEFISDKLSRKIMTTASEQQAEIAQDEGSEDEKETSPVATIHMKPNTRSGGNEKLKQDDLRDADLDDDSGDIGIEEIDEAQLEMFMPTNQPSRRNLADMIMAKIMEKEAGGPTSVPEDTEALDPKLVAVYNQVGDYLASFTSGKIPKAFKIIPSLKNWEEILLLTNPDKWTAQSYFVATRLFASNLNEKMAQRFFNTILLPKIREDIEVKKKLNFHLYASIKKAIYKPAAFFRGILLPLAAEDCTAKEALIMSSILSKVSIPALHASVALMKLANMPYSGATTLFMKTLLDKKYSLPYRVIDSMTKHFIKFQNDPRRLPVIWHQNVLMFVQRYKNDLSPEQKDGLRAVLRKHTHPTITSEVRRELNQEVTPTMMEV
jgi:essential nuclear protein 1